MIDADNFNSETMSVLLINNFASATMLQNASACMGIAPNRLSDCQG